MNCTYCNQKCEPANPVKGPQWDSNVESWNCNKHPNKGINFIVIKAILYETCVYYKYNGNQYHVMFFHECPTPMKPFCVEKNGYTALRLEDIPNIPLEGMEKKIVTWITFS